jgi:alkylated DNA repair dioxygenase AlkB
MKINELLNEKAVSSTWVSDVTNHRSKKIVRMTLSDGKVYLIHGMSRRQFDHWHNSASKGKFFHKNVKGRYNITRVM